MKPAQNFGENFPSVIDVVEYRFEFGEKLNWRLRSE